MSQKKEHKWDHHYSGALSEEFWERIQRLPHKEGGETAYMLGIALQELEERMLRYLCDAERKFRPAKSAPTPGEATAGKRGEMSEWISVTEQSQQKSRQVAEMEARIETLIGTTCKRCERGDALFVEPDTGFYTHTLGGNYCDAHRLHSVLNTKAGVEARTALERSTDE